MDTKAQKVVFLSPLHLDFALDPEMDSGATILLADHTVREMSETDLGDSS